MKGMRFSMNQDSVKRRWSVGDDKKWIRPVEFRYCRPKRSCGNREHHRNIRLKKEKRKKSMSLLSKNLFNNIISTKIADGYSAIKVMC